MKTTKFSLSVFAAAILAICMTGCGTTRENRKVKDLTPTSAMADESSRSTLDVLGWHNETVKMDVASTNSGGYFHSDNTTSHQSGFHPIRALFDGVSDRFNVTYDNRGHSSEWVGSVRLAQNCPQVVQGGGAYNPPVALDQSYGQGQYVEAAIPQDRSLLGWDQFGVGIYFSADHRGQYFRGGQWFQGRPPIARFYYPQQRRSLFPGDGSNRGGVMDGRGQGSGHNSGGFQGGRGNGQDGSHQSGRGGQQGSGNHNGVGNRGGGFGGNGGHGGGGGHGSNGHN